VGLHAAQDTSGPGGAVPSRSPRRWPRVAALGAAALVLLGGAVCLSSCSLQLVLDRADDGRAILLRSGQPSAADLRSLHAQHGIRTVINLRGEEDGRPWFEAEREAVSAIGARWVHIRMSGSRPPPPEHVEAFFGLVEDPTNWPVLIHCWGGVHRTGTLSALYRIQHQGWSNDDAVAEMESFWFDWTTRDRSRLKEFVRAYRRAARPAIDRSAAASTAAGARAQGDQQP